MSKPITTVAMMILLDRGSYDLNDNLSKYLPDLKVSAAPYGSALACIISYGSVSYTHLTLPTSDLV